MIQLTINGTVKQFDGDPAMPLLWYLRDMLELTGTKFGCGIGLCGACTVHVNGKPARSCVVTHERRCRQTHHHHRGLERQRRPSGPESLEGGNVPQCGYCQAGQIMQAAALLKEKPKPTDREIDAPCRATSAAAAHTNGSGRRSRWPRG